MGFKHKVIAYFSGFNSGWSEVIYLDRAEESPGFVASLLIPAMQARAKALGKGYQIDAYTVRLVQNAAGQPVRGVGFLNLANGLPYVPEQVAANVGDPTFVAGRYIATNAAGTERRQGFLGGLPDAVTASGGRLDVSQRNWGGNVNEYLTLLLQLGAGWLSYQEQAVANLTGYSTNQGMVGAITVDAPIFAPYAPGTLLPVRISRLNGGGKSVLNGGHIAKVETATSVTLTTPRAAGPFIAPGRLRVYPPVPAWIPWAGYQLVERASVHKRGRPFVLRPGRSKARPTY